MFTTVALVVLVLVVAALTYALIVASRNLREAEDELGVSDHALAMTTQRKFDLLEQLGQAHAELSELRDRLGVRRALVNDLTKQRDDYRNALMTAVDERDEAKDDLEDCEAILIGADDFVKELSAAIRTQGIEDPQAWLVALAKGQVELVTDPAVMDKPKPAEPKQDDPKPTKKSKKGAK